jgi:hypothetical protein
MPDDIQNDELESGWLPSTPTGDTYLRRYLLSWASMCAASSTSVGGTSRDLPQVRLADAGRPAAFTNFATLMRPLEAATVAETMAEIGSFFRLDDAARNGEALLFSAWPTGDLRPFGWNLMGYPPLLLLPRGATPRTIPDSLLIEEVRDLKALHAWERVGIEGFPLDGFDNALPGALTSPTWLEQPNRRMWIGWEGNRAVCASAAWTEYGINNVTLVATLPDARRRGYGEALTWRASLADPSVPAMLFSSDDGRPVYERMGYLPLQRLSLWYWAPGMLP